LQNIEVGKDGMAAEITSFLQRGWENLWKNKVLWLFSSLGLISSILNLVVPNQRNVDLESALLNLVVSLVTIYFTVLGFTGVSFVAYHTAVGNLVNFGDALQASRKLFLRVVAFSLLAIVVLAPCACALVFAFSPRESPNIENLSKIFFLTSFPFSIFSAMWYFPITETIANRSKFGKCLRTAWTVFTANFVNLAIIGLLLTGAFYLINIVIGIVMMLVQSGFDISALSKLNFFNPQLSFFDNRIYSLIFDIPGAVLRAYYASIFTVAYLEYSSANMSKPITSYAEKTA
jgi:hypothetical protein